MLIKLIELMLVMRFADVQCTAPLSLLLHFAANINFSLLSNRNMKPAFNSRFADSEILLVLLL